MLKNFAEAVVRRSPAFAVKAAAQTFRRLPFGMRFAFFVADRGRVPASANGVRISNDPPLHLVPDGSTITNISYFVGADAWEPGESRVWSKLCAASNNVVEIGGNIGFFTVIGAAATKGRYRVVEPHPSNTRSLRANVQRNNLTNVEVIEAAVVGARGPGKITLHIPSRETGRQSTGAYIDGAEGIDRPGTERFDVATVSGTDLADGVDLLKLDVEGAEFEILESMEAGIVKSRPIIIVEVRRPNRTPALRAWVRRYCEENGYEIWALNEHPALIKASDMDTVVLQDTYGTRDLLLVPPERKDRVRGILPV